MLAAETEVRTPLRQVDPADQLPLRIEDRDAVEPLLAHAPPDPQVPVDIDPQAVGSAVGLGREEGLSARELRSAGYVEDANHPRRHPGLDHVELRLIRREGQ